MMSVIEDTSASVATESPPKPPPAIRRRPSPFFGASLGHDLGTPWPVERLIQDLANRPATATARLGQLLACAIWHGALLAPVWWAKWLEAAQTDISFEDRLWLEMGAVDEADLYWPTSYGRRWFADPLSQILILRWRGEFPEDVAIEAPAPLICLAAYLDPDGAIFGGRLNELQDTLLGAATLRWRLRMPGVVADYAVGKSHALSVAPHQWVRIVTNRAVQVAHPAAKVPRLKAPAVKRAELSPTDLADVDHLVRLKAALNETPQTSSSRSPAERRTVVMAELLKLSPTPSACSRVADHMVQWVLDMLTRKKDGTANWYFQPSSALGYFNAVRRHLLTHSQVVDLENVEPEVWQAQCFQSIAQCPIGTQRNTLISAIMALQNYLVGHRRDLEIDAEILNSMRSQTVVARALVSSEDYKRALNALSAITLIEICTMRIFLILGFRTGMRFAEIYRLTVNDFILTTDQDGRRVFEVAVRNGREGKTKTEKSRRIIPLHLLLDDGANDHGVEAEEVIRWVGHRRDEAQRTGQLRLFVNPDLPLERPAVKKLQSLLENLLVDVTGASDVSFGSLRHSFASYLLATLLLTDDGDIGMRIQGLDDDAVSASRKLRIATPLLGSGRLGQAALHAVSQLCGHAPVSTTLHNYVHLLDWTLGSYVNRRSVQPGMTIADAAGLTTMSPVALRKMNQRTERVKPSEISLDTDDDQYLPVFAQRPRRQRGRAAGEGAPSIYIDSVLAAASSSIVKAARSAGCPIITVGERAIRRRQVVVEPASRASIRRLDWRIIHQALSANRGNVAPREFAQSSNIPLELVLAWDVGAAAFRSAKKGQKYRHLAARSTVNELGAGFPIRPTNERNDLAADRFWRSGIVAACKPGRGAQFNRGLAVFREFYDGEKNEVRPEKMADARAFFRVLLELGTGDKVPAGVVIQHHPGRGRGVLPDAQVLLALEGKANRGSRFPGQVSFVLSYERMRGGELQPTGLGSDRGLWFTLTMLTIACAAGRATMMKKFEAGFVEPRVQAPATMMLDAMSNFGVELEPAGLDSR